MTGPSGEATAIVASVNSFGIFLQRDDQRIFVHLPELSWVFPYSPLLHFTPGDPIKVLILDDIHQSTFNEKSGSIRLLHPEAALHTRVRPGDYVLAKVSRLRTASLTAELGENLHVDLPLNDDVARPNAGLAEGNSITLIVKEVTPGGQTFFEWK
jgi:ribosomal protein S1